MIANGKVHPDVIPFLQDIPVIALPKGSCDIRPIGLQIALKKLAAKCILTDKDVLAKIQERLIADNLQYCLTSFGTE